MGLLSSSMDSAMRMLSTTTSLRSPPLICWSNSCMTRGSIYHCPDCHPTSCLSKSPRLSIIISPTEVELLWSNSPSPWPTLSRITNVKQRPSIQLLATYINRVDLAPALPHQRRRTSSSHELQDSIGCLS